MYFYVFRWYFIETVLSVLPVCPLLDWHQALFPQKFAPKKIDASFSFKNALNNCTMVKIFLDWSDSDIIPRNSKIFEFQKNFILILLSIKNAVHSSNLVVLASAQGDFSLKNVLNLVYWHTWSKSKIFQKIWFSLDSVFDSVYHYFFCSIKMFQTRIIAIWNQAI